MPDLLHALQGNDFGFLRIVANTWGIELPQPDSYTALPALVNGIQNKQLVSEIVEALPVEARLALESLFENQGMIPWQVFIRRFGEVRIMGAGRRDRERPDLNPISPAEILWYRALISKAFFNAAPEPQEFAYIPDDLLDMLQPVVKFSNAPLGRPASPGEIAFIYPANDHILDYTCTLLAALRTGVTLPEKEIKEWPIPVQMLSEILRSAKLIDHHKAPQAEAIRKFLEAPRSEALVFLANAWLNSATYNDLKLLPGLKFEGNWRNDPLITRQGLVNMVKGLSASWWNLNSFVLAVRDQHPDFQRPGGDYDSWFIYQESSQSYLRGFSTWNEVDGALIRSVITGMLHWLGFLDLAAPSQGTSPEAFRPSKWFESLLTGKTPTGFKKEEASMRVTADGCIALSELTPRAIRYQIARFGHFESHSQKTYSYRLTPKSMERAGQQGLRVVHLIRLLRKQTAAPIPPGLIQSLERWEKLGVQAQLESVMILRVNDPEIISLLKQKHIVKRYLGETLNPSTILVKPSGKEAILQALLEAGYFLDADLLE